VSECRTAFRQFGIRPFNNMEGNAMARDDKGVVAVFRNDIVKNIGKSIEAGRPIFDDVEVVELRYPGSKNVGVFPAMDFSHWEEDEAYGGQRACTYAERFSRQYQQFRAHQQQTKSGTPLDYLPFLTEAKRAELRALNIYTAEALTIVDGPELKNLGPGGRDLKNQAIAFLESSSDMAKVTKLEAELEAMRARNQVLEDDIKNGMLDKQPVSEFDSMTDEQLRAHIKALTGAAPKGNPARRTLIRMAQEQKTNVAA
jgi:hypothetical protein